MPLNIPLPGVPGDTFRKALNSGTAAYSQYIQPIIERERQKQYANQFQQEIALRKQNAARSGAFDPIRKMILEQQLMKLKNSNNPLYDYQQFQNLAKMIHGDQQSEHQGQQGQEQPSPQQEQQMLAGQGQGVFNPDDMTGKNQSNDFSSQNNNPYQGINLEELKAHPLLRGAFKKKFNYDPLESKGQTESPEQKRYADLQYKLAFENEKNKLSDDKKRTEVIDNAKKDTKTLSGSLDALQRVQKIIEQNPDLFGHNWQGNDRFLNSTKNENAGKMTSLLKKFIIDVEKDASTRGSQLALKFAIKQKPNFEQSQNVALGNVKESIRMLQEALKDARTLSNPNSGNNNDDFSKMSDEELQRIASGGN